MIKDIIYNHIDNYLKSHEISAKVCIVDSVNGVLIDVTPVDGSAPLQDVRLKATDSDKKGMVFVPVVESKCVVVFESKTSAFMLYADEVDNIVFRDGENGGLINISDLVSKMNDIENAHNNHIHITTATVGATPTAGTIAPTTTTLTPTQVQDIEDDKILH